jgi:hypothetical protein
MKELSNYEKSSNLVDIHSWKNGATTEAKKMARIFEQGNAGP